MINENVFLPLYSARMIFSLTPFKVEKYSSETFSPKTSVYATLFPTLATVEVALTSEFDRLISGIGVRVTE